MSKFLLVDTSKRIFEEGEHFNTSMIIKDRFDDRTEIRLSHWKAAKDSHVTTLLCIEHHCLRFSIFGITPDQARDLADKLYDFSATCDAHIAQLEREKQEAAHTQPEAA